MADANEIFFPFGKCKLFVLPFPDEAKRSRVAAVVVAGDVPPIKFNVVAESSSPKAGKGSKGNKLG